MIKGWNVELLPSGKIRVDAPNGSYNLFTRDGKIHPDRPQSATLKVSDIPEEVKDKAKKVSKL